MDDVNETLYNLQIGRIPSGNILPPENETDSMNNQLKAYSIVIPALGSVIILTNLIVVISSGLILKTGQQPKCTYLLLGNVAMADLITGIAVIVGNVYPKENRTHLVCTIQIGMIVSTTIASVYSVGLIAIDRYLYIVHGLMYNQWVHPGRARICIILTWTLGCVIGFLPLMGWSGDTDNGRICWLTLVLPWELIIGVSILGFIPVILIIWLYSIILIKAIRKVIQLNSSDQVNAGITPKLRISRGNQSVNRFQVSTVENERAQHRPENASKRNNLNALRSQKNENFEAANKRFNDKQPNKWKAIKVVMLTTGSFVFTWLPYFIACTVFVFCDFDETPKTCQNLKYAIASPLAILGFFNSLLNPLIYAWWHNGFRKTLKKIFRKKKGTKALMIPAKSSSRLTQTSSTTSNSTSSERISTIVETPEI